MKIHPTKDKVELPIDTTKDKVRTIHRTVKVDKHATSKYECTLELNFEGCKHHDLLKLATETVWIRIQSRFRKKFAGGGDPMKSAGDWERSWNVKDEILNAERATVDPVTKADNALTSLPADELLKIMAKHGFVKKA